MESVRDKDDNAGSYTVVHGPAVQQFQLLSEESKTTVALEMAGGVTPIKHHMGLFLPHFPRCLIPWHASTLSLRVARCTGANARVRQDQYLRWGLPPQRHICQPVGPSFPSFISLAIHIYALNLRVCISHRLTREALPRTNGVTGIE